MPSKRGVILYLLCALFTLQAWAQIITGTIRGVVTDSEGRPLAGVTVLVNSTSQSGQTRYLTTNDLGVFHCPALPVGVYSVEAQLTGFQSVHANRVEVDVSRTTNLPLTMKLAISETIEVVGDTPMIDSQNAGVPTFFKQEMVENIPTSRHMWILMQVAPGLTTDNNNGLDSGIIAFGSNRQSNSWNIDGLDITSPDRGNPRFEVNPDMIEQIQVYGLGAPAEHGNHTGAILNVITKKGSNDLHGSVNSFFQSQALTGTNVRLPDSDFVFHRDKYYDVTGQLGGPILKDKIWFFGAMQSKRDAFSSPGNNPDYATLTKLDRYDLKATARVGKKYDISGFFHDEDYDIPEPTRPFYTKSALAHSFGGTSAWGATFTSAFNKKLLLELGYAGWGGESFRGSQTGSLESPLELTEPDSFELIGYSGGIKRPSDKETYRHQIRAKATYYADRFLKSQHEFRFGVQYFNGSSVQVSGIGPNASNYQDGYDYGDPGFRVTYQTPYSSGGVSNGLGFFVDDTVTLNQRVTLNLGIRFDHNTGSVPDFARLEVGTPSITEIANFKRTDEILPGIKNIVEWNLFSPRLGFVWRTREDGRAALRGSFGVYYDHDTTGNWHFPPPPQMPPTKHYYVDEEGQWNDVGSQGIRVEYPRDQQLRPPRALQYSLGYEFQPTNNSSIGLQFVHKDTTNLIGWQITGGQWKTVPFIDPFTGREYALLFPDGSPPGIHLGNDPGNFPGSEGLRYFQKYDGIILTLGKRFADSWMLNASYTWSRSSGLLPTMLSDFQYNPLFGSIEGADPNNFINATGRLQGDRPHMFRAQVVFFKLPWDLQTAASVDFSSGTPYARQIVAYVPDGFSFVIMEPGGSLRHSPVQNIDLSIGKRVSIGNRVQVTIDAEILNLLNSDQELQFDTLLLSDPTERFVPIAWVEPRRLQLQLGFQF